MAEILHFEILRKHGQTHTHTHTHTQTDRQTDRGITIPRPPPMGGEVIIIILEAVPDEMLLYITNASLFHKNIA